jgi:hypothetical protein
MAKLNSVGDNRKQRGKLVLGALCCLCESLGPGKRESGACTRSDTVGKMNPSSLGDTDRVRAACARATDEVRTRVLREEQTEAWWCALRRIEIASSV